MNSLNILYEDNHIIVVEKKFNMLVQADDTNDTDLFSLIKEYIKEKYNKPGNVYLGLVHRLDRPVGGVMVFAKTSKAASRLSNEIRERNINKTYLAIVHGKTKEKERLVDKISKDSKTYNSFIDNKNGKESILEYETLCYDEKEDLSLVKINLETGRHHQIRVQMNNINHPLYGDQRYGVQDKKQIALYAYKLELTHPVSKEKMVFKLLPKKDGVWNMLDNVKEEL